MAEKPTAVNTPAFVPAVVDVAALLTTGAAEGASKPAPVLELEIGGSSVWVWREAKIDLVTAAFAR